MPRPDPTRNPPGIVTTAPQAAWEPPNGPTAALTDPDATPGNRSRAEGDTSIAGSRPWPRRRSAVEWPVGESKRSGVKRTKPRGKSPQVPWHRKWRRIPRSMKPEQIGGIATRAEACRDRCAPDRGARRCARSSSSADEDPRSASGVVAHGFVGNPGDEHRHRFCHLKRLIGARLLSRLVSSRPSTGIEGDSAFVGLIKKFNLLKVQPSKSLNELVREKAIPLRK
jgi:hypothetical protein